MCSSPSPLVHVHITASVSAPPSTQIAEEKEPAAWVSSLIYMVDQVPKTQTVGQAEKKKKTLISDSSARGQN